MPRPYRLRLMDTYRNLFYTPLYAAVAGGFFYAQNLDVMFTTVPPNRSAIDILHRQDAHIVQTGISRSMMALDDNDHNAPLHIAEINRRDGFFILSKNPTHNWRWNHLEGATLIPIGFTPVPLTTLAAALRKHHVGINKINLLNNLPAEQAISAFLEGRAEYIHLPNPQAQTLIHDGAAHLAASLGNEHGYLCYSSFAATPDFINQRPDVIQNFVSAFHNAQQWLAANNPHDIANLIKPFFANTPEHILQASIAQYKNLHTWAETPTIGLDGYNAMRQMLIDGNLVKGTYDYQRLVQPQFAQQAVSPQ